jgi:excisionase family DNA binding protein
VSTADITWLNTVETARRLGITPRTLYRFIDDGKLPAYRFGRVIRLKESEVAEFIESCRITPGTLDAAAVPEDPGAGDDPTGGDVTALGNAESSPG